MPKHFYLDYSLKIKSQKESVRKKAVLKSSLSNSKISLHAALSTLLIADRKKYFPFLLCFPQFHMHKLFIA